MYKNDRGNLLRVIEHEKIIIFGCGLDGHRLANELRRMGFSIIGAYDNNTDLWNTWLKIGTVDVCRIMPLQEFKEKCAEAGTRVIVASGKYVAEMVRQLLDLHIYNYYIRDDIDFPAGEEYYDAAYFEWQEKIGRFGAKKKKKLFLPYLRDTESILEFGCGGGFLLDELPISNMNKTGVEINEYARKECIEKGIRCYESLDGVEDESVDLVISTMALEHVYNPFGVIEDVRKKLRVGGRAVFHVPYEHGDDCEYKRNDFHNHLFTWTPMALGNLFKTARFFVEEIRTIDGFWPDEFYSLDDQYGEVLFEELEKLNGLIRCKQSILISAQKDRR